jgi:hypothetical protein
MSSHMPFLELVSSRQERPALAAFTLVSAGRRVWRFGHAPVKSNEADPARAVGIPGQASV